MMNKSNKTSKSSMFGNSRKGALDKQKMKNKLFLVLLSIILVFNVAKVLSYAEEYTFDIVLCVNDESYGSVICDDSLTDLNPGTAIELSAVPNPSAYVNFLKWVVYKGSDFTTLAEEGEDYSISDYSEHAYITALKSQDLKIKAVFRGRIVNVIERQGYKPATMGIYTFSFRSSPSSPSPNSSASEISGWNNNPNDPVKAELTLVGCPSDEDGDSFFRVNKTLAGLVGPDSLLSPGASFDFSPFEVYSEDEGKAILLIPVNTYWQGMNFRIVDEENKTLKTIELTFKYPGLATISAENGTIYVEDVPYRDGDKVKVGVEESEIRAVPDAGYEFKGWAISGVELEDPTENPLIFRMPLDDLDVVITAVFEKQEVSSDITVTTNSSAFIEGRDYSINGNVVTVSYSSPCKVGYLGDNGKYIAIDAVKLEGQENAYTFTVDNPDVTEVLLVLKGDTYGDGRINNTDVARTKAAYLGKTTLNPVEEFAADAYVDGRINNTDVARIKAVYLGKTEFSW